MAAPFQRAVTGITATKGSSCFKVLAKKRRTAKPAGPGRCDNLLRRDNRGPGELVDRLPKGRRAAVRLEKPCAIGRRMRPGRQSSLNRAGPRGKRPNPPGAQRAAAVRASAIWTDILQAAVLPRLRSGLLQDIRVLLQ